ncbi:hypothetical protein N6H14_03465 [Paenibacillus sp. CC-CFT747]|nr:hypothetical protein N6H14_03465 [Paenibacillus sp. CC-CFT747]
MIVTIILGLGTMLALFREMVIAYQFGASSTTDAYLVAMIIPTLFIESIKGSFTKTFITVFVYYRAQHKKKESWIMTNVVLSFFILGLTLLTLIAIIFTPAIVGTIAPNYFGELQELTINLTRYLLPTLFLEGYLVFWLGSTMRINLLLYRLLLGLFIMEQLS